MEKLPWIDEDALIANHPQIFHYTDLGAFRKILESGGLFATHYGETNDRDEFRALRQPMSEIIYARLLGRVRKYMESGELRFPDEETAQSITRSESNLMFDTLVNTTPIPPHITCFCAHVSPHQVLNGLLTMWRLYSDKKVGRVALGFDTKAVVAETRRLMNEYRLYACYLDRVSYGPEDPQTVRRLVEDSEYLRIFDMTLEALIASARSGTIPPDQLGLELTDLLKFYVACASAKHQDFADEHEIRLVVAEQTPIAEDLRREIPKPIPGRLRLPYLIALNEVMIGPNQNQDDLATVVRRELDEAGFAHVPVSCSNTGYRDSG